jgi:SAM-dependent methyltransferase
MLKLTRNIFLLVLVFIGSWVSAGQALSQSEQEFVKKNYVSDKEAIALKKLFGSIDDDFKTILNGDVPRDMSCNNMTRLIKKHGFTIYSVRFSCDQRVTKLVLRHPSLSSHMMKIGCDKGFPNKNISRVLVASRINNIVDSYKITCVEKLNKKLYCRPGCQDDLCDFNYVVICPIIQGLSCDQVSVMPKNPTASLNDAAFLMFNNLQPNYATKKLRFSLNPSKILLTSDYKFALVNTSLPTVQACKEVEEEQFSDAVWQPGLVNPAAVVHFSLFHYYNPDAPLPDFSFRNLRKLDRLDIPDDESNSWPASQMLNLMKYSRSNLYGSEYEIGYHSIKIGNKSFRGQRDPVERLKNVKYDFIGKTVLDIGSCSGGMLLAIADKIKHGVGIDFNYKMINLSNKLKSYNKITNLDFYVFDLEKEDLCVMNNFLNGEKVDICFILSICQWIKNWKEVIDYAYEISESLLFESNDSAKKKEEQDYLKSKYKKVELVAGNSDDDPLHTGRELYLCSKD